MNDLAGLTKFATRYAEAWCSQNPESVAAFFAENGSLSVNDGPPAIGRRVRISGYELWKIDNDGLIAESKGHIDSAEYERQLKDGVGD